MNKMAYRGLDAASDLYLLSAWSTMMEDTPQNPGPPVHSSTTTSTSPPDFWPLVTSLASLSLGTPRPKLASSAGMSSAASQESSSLSSSQESSPERVLMGAAKARVSRSEAASAGDEECNFWGSSSSSIYPEPPMTPGGMSLCDEDFGDRFSLPPIGYDRQLRLELDCSGHSSHFAGFPNYSSVPVQQRTRPVGAPSQQWVPEMHVPDHQRVPELGPPGRLNAPAYSQRLDQRYGRPILKTGVNIMTGGADEPPTTTQAYPTPSTRRSSPPGQYGFYTVKKGRNNNTSNSNRRDRSTWTKTGGASGPFCGFCTKNGETPEFANTHKLKDCWGRVICPVLRAYKCQTCGATGDDAHTSNYCPYRK